MLGANNQQQRTDRRRVLGTSAVLGGGILAGCLGDDDDVGDVADVDDTDDIDDVTDVDDIDDVDDADDGDDVDDADDEPIEIERHDAAPWLFTAPPLPADVQYNLWATAEQPAPSWMVGENDRYVTAGFSFADLNLYGQLVSDWDYQPGLLEVTFEDDFYWWSGDVCNAVDWVTDMTLRDWVDGGADFDAHPEIITFEILDDFAVRVALADTWTEGWAVWQTLVNFPQREIDASRAFNQPWIEQFEDTGGDIDAVEDVREALSSDVVTDDEGLVHHWHIPFEFRLDGSLGDIGEHHWDLELVPEKDGNLRHYADLINFEGLHVVAAEEAGIASDDAWANEDIPSIGAQAAEESDVDFDWYVETMQREFDNWSWTFNCEIHPTNVPQFRRAWMFMADRTLWEQPHLSTQEHAGPWLTDQRLETFVSEDIVDAFTDYGKDTVMWDRAEEEMVIGGFEQNDDGDWMDHDGEPIEFTSGAHGWMGWVGDIGGDFWADINEFGLDVEFVADIQDSFYVSAQYHGGVIPEFVFESIFGESSLSWAAPNPNLPESVDAPPVGETDADPDSWIEYQTRAMADRLAVTVDEDQYQIMVDELTWIHNQILPRGLVNAQTIMSAFNDNRWRVQSLEERPEEWIRLPGDHMWYNGVLTYVPEEER